MADNTQLNAGSGGDLVRDKDRSGIKTQIVALDLNPAGAESLMDGAMPVKQIDAETSMYTSITSFRDLITAMRYPFWWDSLADGISSSWVQTLANGGTITSTGGEGLFQTSANAAGSAQAISPVLDYIGGQISWVFATMRFGDTGSAGNVRRVGAFTISAGVPQDGFYIEESGTTINAVVVKGGAASAVASNLWSKFSTAPFTVDVNYVGLEIRFAGNRVDFYLGGVLRHTVVGTTAPLTNTLNLPAAVQNINTSGATNRVIAVRNIGLGRFGTQPSSQQKATYRASTNAVEVAPVTTPAPFFTIYGSATKTVKVQSIIISGLTLTAIQYLNIGLRRYSTAASGGTQGVALTAVRLDSISPAPTAVPAAYTVAPTAGTVVGELSSRRVIGQATTAVAAGIPQVVDFDFTPIGEGQAVILRGVTEGIGLYWIAPAPASAVSMLIRVEWVEE